MRNVINKDFVRDILKSKGRFFSIMAIVALGVAFFSGVKSAPLVMKNSSDKYYDNYNLMDIRLVSTLGLTDKDISEIKKISKVDEIYPTYSMDVISKYSSSENVLKIHGIDLDKIKNDKNYINQLKVIKGRLPSKSSECVLEIPKIKLLDYPIGSKIELTSGTDDKLSDLLSDTKYTVVGYVQTPYYLSQEKGNSSIGSGVVEGAIMIPQDNFELDAYTEIFLTVEGAKNLDTYSKEYSNLVRKVTDKLESLKDKLEIRRYNEVVKEAEDKLYKEEDKLYKAKESLENGKNEYEENKLKAKQELQDAENKINNYIQEIENGEAKLKSEKESTYLKIEQGQYNLDQAEDKLIKGKEKYESELSEFNVKKEIAKAEIEDGTIKLQEINNEITGLKNTNILIVEQLKDNNLSQEEREQLKKKINQNLYLLSILEKNYVDGNEKLESSKEQLKASEDKLKESKIILEQNKEKIESEKLNLNSSKVLADEKFKEAEEELSKNKEYIKKAKKELTENKLKIEYELNEAQEKLEKAETEIKDGEEKIEEAENKINKIEKPTLYILDRDSHQSFVEYEGCADSIDALAKVFPVFFFAVAALVCLTTMTRMVDEQRINIGTLKGLGYRTGQICKKYILYALTACLIGSFIGLIIGFTLFPTVIYYAYEMMYSIDKIIYIFNIPIALGITSVALIIITFSAYLACYKELKETPAILMRPRAPKSGKRILLEKIPFIWNKFGFITKVTVRNIFRYKKRFLMTILGIAGCTALTLTGFGIKDSIEIIVTKQYGNLFRYDMSIVTKSNTSSKEIEKIKYELSKISDIDKYEFFSYENGNIKVNNKTKEITIVVPQNLNKMDEYIHLQDRKTQKHIELENDGIVITEKIAKDLGMNVGDEIELINNNKKKVKVKINGITENYISNYAYISPNSYNSLFKENIKFNRILAVLDNLNVKVEKQLSQKLFKIKTINGIIFNTSSKETFHNTIKNLNYVVLVMIISAGALAFVVLYNLTNVNISERIREIATIKVLGFYDNEVSAYIYRENIILTIIGTVVGLGLGTMLHQFIMVTVEIQSIMFGRVIDKSSYFVAAILTIVLSLFVNIAMFYKLKNVKMVESLKSID